jgi:hypothetical protein
MRKINLVVLTIITAACSGCTGMEIGGKLWITRVDQKQESQATHNVPLKCYLWSDCSQPVENLK